MSNRDLFIAGHRIDLDENTAIGVTITPFDVTDPSKIVVKATNQFSIPATKNNLSLFGHPHDLQSSDDAVYNKMSVSYYVDGVEYFSGSQVIMQSIDFE